MPFPYYARLSKRAQATYRRSDAVAAVRIAEPSALRPFVDGIGEGLAQDDQHAVAHAAQALTDGITTGLDVPPVDVEVLAVRPSSAQGELHGLYTASPDEEPRIRVWMRTAKQGRVVAFRTFLRTLLHEVCHHLDYALLDLDDSFHTEGFFKRESSLFHQLVPEARATARARKGRGADG